MEYKKVWHFGTDKADVYIYEPELGMTHEETQEYLDREVAPILGRMARGIQRDYEELCKKGYKGSFNDFYEQRTKERRVRERVAEAKAIGLKDVTHLFYPDKA
ncbi:MAG: hypothetical protein ACRC41_07945 [Sarcina sp.]